MKLAINNDPSFWLPLFSVKFYIVVARVTDCSKYQQSNELLEFGVYLGDR
ncbi:hypothetical protein [Scytonema millei]|uniref:Uncharacterized protein n=1 Tax=Scytonema millei VB511283 TaxID=1245923 RepID=A0A9X5E4E7_9CYAN|nr:hypothetical protein [Scytonema millei]NHC34959.1 hypothetical protein [Scytonema millei VB511283]